MSLNLNASQDLQYDSSNTKGLFPPVPFLPYVPLVVQRDLNSSSSDFDAEVSFDSSFHSSSVQDIVTDDKPLTSNEAPVSLGNELIRVVNEKLTPQESLVQGQPTQTFIKELKEVVEQVGANLNPIQALNDYSSFVSKQNFFYKKVIKESLSHMLTTSLPSEYQFQTNRLLDFQRNSYKLSQSVDYLTREISFKKGLKQIRDEFILTGQLLVTTTNSLPFPLFLWSSPSYEEANIGVLDDIDTKLNFESEYLGSLQEIIDEEINKEADKRDPKKIFFYLVRKMGTVTASLQPKEKDFLIAESRNKLIGAVIEEIEALNMDPFIVDHIMNNQAVQMARTVINHEDIDAAYTKFDQEQTLIAAKEYVSLIDRIYNSNLNCQILGSICERYYALQKYSTIDLTKTRQNSIDTTGKVETINIYQVQQLRTFLISEYESKSLKNPKFEQDILKLETYIKDYYENTPTSIQLADRALSLVTALPAMLKTFDALDNYRMEDFAYLYDDEVIKNVKDSIILLKYFEMVSANRDDIRILQSCMERLGEVLFFAETDFTNSQQTNPLLTLLIDYMDGTFKPTDTQNDVEQEIIQYDTMYKPKEEIIADISTGTSVAYNIYLLKTRFQIDSKNPSLLFYRMQPSKDQKLIHFLENAEQLQGFNKDFIRIWNFKNHHLFVTYVLKFVNQDKEALTTKILLNSFKDIETRNIQSNQIEIGTQLWKGVRAYIEKEPQIIKYKSDLVSKLPEGLKFWEDYKTNPVKEGFPHVEMDNYYRSLSLVTDSYVTEHHRFVLDVATFFTSEFSTLEGFINAHSFYFLGNQAVPVILIAVQGIFLQQKIPTTFYKDSPLLLIGGDNINKLPFQVDETLVTFYNEYSNKFDQDKFIAKLFTISHEHQIAFSQLLLFASVPTETLRSALTTGSITQNKQVNLILANSNLLTPEAKKTLVSSIHLNKHIGESLGTSFNDPETKNIIKTAFDEENVDLIRAIYSGTFHDQGRRPNYNLFRSLLEQFPEPSKSRTVAFDALIQQNGLPIISDEGASDYQKILFAVGSKVVISDDQSNEEQIAKVDGVLKDLFDKEKLTVHVDYLGNTVELAKTAFLDCKNAECVNSVRISFNDDIALKLAAEQVLKTNNKSGLDSFTKQMNEALIDIIGHGYKKIVETCKATRKEGNAVSMAKILPAWSKEQKESFLFGGVIEFCIAFDLDLFDLQQQTIELIGEDAFKLFVSKTVFTKETITELNSSQISLMRFFIGKGKDGTAVYSKEKPDTAKEVHDLYQKLWSPNEKKNPEENRDSGQQEPSASKDPPKEGATDTVADLAEVIQRYAKGEINLEEIVSYNYEAKSYKLIDILDLTKGNDYLYLYTAFARASPADFVSLIVEGNVVLDQIRDATVNGTVNEILKDQILKDFINDNVTKAHVNDYNEKHPPSWFDTILNFYLSWTRYLFNVDETSPFRFVFDFFFFVSLTQVVRFISKRKVTKKAVNFFYDCIANILNYTVGGLFYFALDYGIKPLGNSIINGVKFSWDKLSSIVLGGDDNSTIILRNLYNVAKADEENNLCLEVDKLFIDEIQASKGGGQEGGGFKKYAFLLYSLLSGLLNNTSALSNKPEISLQDLKSTISDNFRLSWDDERQIEANFKAADINGNGLLNNEELYRFFETSISEEDKVITKKHTWLNNEGVEVIELDSNSDHDRNNNKYRLLRQKMQNTQTPPENPPTNQPTGPPTKQPTGPPTKQPTSPPTNQPTGQTPTRPPPTSPPPTSPPTNQPTGQTPTRPPNQPSGPPTGPPTAPPKKSFAELQAEFEAQAKKEAKDDLEAPIIAQLNADFDRTYRENNELLRNGETFQFFYQTFWKTVPKADKISNDDIRDFFLNQMKADLEKWKNIQRTNRLTKLHNKDAEVDTDYTPEGSMLGSNGQLLTTEELEDIFTPEVFQEQILPTLIFVNEIKRIGAAAVDEKVEQLGRYLNFDYKLVVGKGTNKDADNMTPELARIVLKVNTLFINDPYSAVRLYSKIQDRLKVASNFHTAEELKKIIKTQDFGSAEEEELYRIEEGLITDDYLDNRGYKTRQDKQDYRTKHNIPPLSLLSETGILNVIDEVISQFIDNIDSNMSPEAEEQYQQKVVLLNRPEWTRTNFADYNQLAFNGMIVGAIFPNIPSRVIMKSFTRRDKCTPFQKMFNTTEEEINKMFETV